MNSCDVSKRLLTSLFLRNLYLLTLFARMSFPNKSVCWENACKILKCFRQTCSVVEAISKPKPNFLNFMPFLQLVFFVTLISCSLLCACFLKQILINSTPTKHTKYYSLDNTVIKMRYWQTQKIPKNKLTNNMEWMLKGKM